MALSNTQISSYQQNGFLYPVEVLSPSETAAQRAQLEMIEKQHDQGAGGHELNQFFRINGQIVLPFLSDIAKNPRILAAVASILGPNLLVWSVELFIKEAGSQKSVSWHQDLTYWGMGETDEELTAWLALSDVSVEAGCMRFFPGSHKGRIVEHADTFSDDNLLSRGQEIADVREEDAKHAPLEPGHMSLHHGRVFHASSPNNSDDRRIGVAIRYVTPNVRQADLGRDYAMLVKGKDEVGGWINVAAPSATFDSDALALYDEILHHQSSTLTAGAEQAVGLYETKGSTT